jgi:hypothetical protein
VPLPGETYCITYMPDGGEGSAYHMTNNVWGPGGLWRGDHLTPHGAGHIVADPQFLDAGGGDFRPAECSGAALIASGEVDAVLAVGRLPPEIEAAIAARSADLAVIRIDDRRDELPGCAGPCVHLRSSPPAGMVLRADGREISVGDPTAVRDDSMTTLLTALHRRLMSGAAS